MRTSRLSHVQADLFFEQLVAPTVPLNNFAAAYHIEGTLDDACLMKAIESAIDGTDALRTVLRDNGEGAEQEVLSVFDAPIESIEFVDEAAAQAWMAIDYQR